MPQRNRRQRQIRKQLKGLRQPGAPQNQLAPDVAQQASQAPLPWNAQYQSTVGGLQRDYRDIMAQQQLQKTGIEQEYGLNDYSDPYSRARLLERSFQQGQQGTTNAMASRGQLYSGATQRARERGVFDYGQQQHALRGEYQQRLSGLDQERLAAERELRQGTAEAQAGRLEEALEERPDPSEAPPAAGGLSQQQQQRKKQLQKQLQKLQKGRGGRGGGGRGGGRRRRRGR